MTTTLNIDDDLLEEARRLTGVHEKTALVREGLEALIARESARRLKDLGGTEPRLRDVPRLCVIGSSSGNLRAATLENGSRFSPTSRAYQAPASQLTMR